jgi:hypothetical protein
LVLISALLAPQVLYGDSSVQIHALKHMRHQCRQQMALCACGVERALASAGWIAELSRKSPAGIDRRRYAHGTFLSSDQSAHVMPDVCLDMRPAIATISGPLVFIIAPETFKNWC